MDLSLVNGILLKCGYCVLIFIHSIYNLLVFMLNYLLFIAKYLKKVYTRDCASICDINIVKELNCCSKLPKHLAVIIEEDDKPISYHDCLKLILWCIHAGIPFISFYSHNSAINPTSLYEVLCKRSKASLQNIKWGKSFHQSVKEMAKKDINGYVWMPLIEVNMFSSKFVFESVENVMLEFCKERIEPDKISIDGVDQKFKKEISVSEPCLAFVFGKTFSTFGFMPWQLRVTEFLHIPTHHSLDVEDFVSALKRYSFCEQRFGK